MRILGLMLSLLLLLSGHAIPIDTHVEIRPGVTRANTSGVGPETVDNWSGYVTVNKTRELFYWFFESRGATRLATLACHACASPAFFHKHRAALWLR